MTVLPAIERELRTQARLGSTYVLRVLGAVVLFGATVFFGLNAGFSPDEGGRLFGFLNGVLFLSIWLIVPLLAADCISSERREGTLGLLFMTPLKARDIVLAKGFVHGLRATALLLAVIPVVTIPFLMGGVSWREALMSVLVNASSICLALAAGLLASSLSKVWLRAQIAACFLSAGFAVGFIYLNGLLAINLANANMPSGTATYYSEFDENNTEVILQAGFLATTDFGGVWGSMLAYLPKTGRFFLFGSGASLFISSLCLFLVVGLAARRLKRVWHEEPPSAGRLWLERKMITPIVGISLLRRWMHRKLERNPIGWLEQRSWSGRLVTWIWFGVLVLLYSVGLGGRHADEILNNLQNVMGWLLLLGMASSAAGSFQRERETGVMELLLVSPMTERQIIGGRVRGLFSQFLPAVVLFVGVWLYYQNVMPEWSNEVEMQFFCGSVLVLPVVGLYFSLRRKTFITAFLCTIFAALLLPLMFAGILKYLLQLLLLNGNDYTQFQSDGRPLYFHDDGFSIMLCRFVASASFLNLLQLAVAVRCGWRLYQDLRRRNFAFSRNVA